MQGRSNYAKAVTAALAGAIVGAVVAWFWAGVILIGGGFLFDLEYMRSSGRDNWSNVVFWLSMAIGAVVGARIAWGEVRPAERATLVNIRQAIGALLLLIAGGGCGIWSMYLIDKFGPYGWRGHLALLVFPIFGIICGALAAYRLIFGDLYVHLRGVWAGANVSARIALVLSCLWIFATGIVFLVFEPLGMFWRTREWIQFATILWGPPVLGIAAVSLIRRALQK